jgi:hypothetical protein
MEERRGKVRKRTDVPLQVPPVTSTDRVQGHMFLTFCELYILLTQSDFIEDQVHIHWALSYFKGRCAASFTERVIR